MAGYNPYQTNSYQATQFFPQPQGNVYMINNSMEIANIPVGGGISVALCPNEALMFIKSMQNGAPTLLAYSCTRNIVFNISLIFTNYLNKKP